MFRHYFAAPDQARAITLMTEGDRAPWLAGGRRRRMHRKTLLQNLAFTDAVCIQ